MPTLQYDFTLTILQSGKVFLFSTVQQAPVCAHQPDEPLVQRPAAGVGGHPSDLRQVP